MPDWSASMTQTFEYYVVDPGTWRDMRRLTTVKSCSISRDLDTESLGSATIDIAEHLDECYIRVYLVTIQNGITEKHPLGTFLIQTPASSYDGKRKGFSMDAYTPLIELKESPPPLGYSIFKNENIMDHAYRLAREKARAPVVKTDCDEKLTNDFVANTNDTWLTFINDLVAQAKYSLSLDEMGRILFAADQRIESSRPVWTYSDSNSSILYPDITLDHDLFGIPNVVEVLYSDGAGYFYAKATNDDGTSPTSIASRGREVLHRVVDPDFGANVSNEYVENYAKELLKKLSSVEYTISYTHGYCPVRLGDCVRLNYNRAGLTDIKARVISQSIKCEPGCPVTEKAIYTTKFWR